MRGILDKKDKNNKGQIDGGIVPFVVLIIALLILAPIMYKVVTSVLGKFSTAIGTQSAQAETASTFVLTKFISIWDIIIFIGFIVAVILLFVSAFMVDVHPAFIILYIIVAFLTMFFAPQAVQVLQYLWTGTDFQEAYGNMPLTVFILNNFSIIMLSLIFITGIIMYAKMKGVSGGSGGGVFAG